MSQIDQLSEDREETLGEFLAGRARRRTDGRLAWQTITAVLTAVAIVAWRGPAWDIRLAVAACLLAFGLWGIADRDLEHDRWGPAARRLLRFARLIAGVVGFAAAAYLMMALLARALGRIIS